MGPASTAAKRVLLVEDDAATAQSVAMMLRAEGYAVDSVDLGAVGLQKAKGGDYDLLVLDLMLPDVKGFEVLRQLKQARVATPVLILSGLAAKDEVLKGFGLGAAVYVTKPFAKDELLDRVHEILFGRRRT